MRVLKFMVGALLSYYSWLLILLVIRNTASGHFDSRSTARVLRTTTSEVLWYTTITIVVTKGGDTSALFSFSELPRPPCCYIIIIYCIMHDYHCSYHYHTPEIVNNVLHVIVTK